MKLLNTLGRKLEDFKPIDPPKVSLYTCGPTVYDYAHIGNLRTFVFYDTLRRALAASGYKVRHVMNITDVGHLTSDADEGEDKLETGAQKQGKTVWEIAQFYTNAFKRDAKLLNTLEPELAKATDYVTQQIEFVDRLLENGFAYKTEKAIYFDVLKLDSYGELTGQKLSEKEVAARKEVISDPNKRHPYDFAVWFFTVGHFANHTMRWDSPWGQGFPGWHLECSAIIHTCLGDPIDIHAAGVDLISPHNTNEEAQTQAAFGHRLANYWLHSEHMMVDGQKMAKSLGNIITLQNIVDKGFDPLALRLLFLQAHYRSQTNFTWEALGAAASALSDIQAWADLKHQPHVAEAGDTDGLDGFIKTMLGHLQSDLDSASALSELHKLILRGQPRRLSTSAYDKLLAFIDDVFGLALADRPDIEDTQKGLIADREAARKSRDWQKSDELRNELIKQKIGINDTEFGPVWYRL